MDVITNRDVSRDVILVILNRGIDGFGEGDERHSDWVDRVGHHWVRSG
jgi:hypothetical protein